jgi:rfaE bifunctional protein nucleotidyltransferase chain/domain/rfaE bifunctional protein kinase chain/domain
MTEPLVVVVGDTLLDRDLDGTVERLAPDAPVPVVDSPVERARPGGAGLAAVLAARGRVRVTLVTALAPDEGGRRLAGLLRDNGVDVIDLGLDGATPEKVRVRTAGHPIVRLDLGGAPGRVRGWTTAAGDALAGATGVLVADYGRGVTALPGLRSALAALPARVPVVWDPHPRGAEPVPGARLVTPNRAEAARFTGRSGEGLADVTKAAAELAGRWRAANVAVTLGPRGALVSTGDGAPLVVPAPPAPGGDPCGAGDRFAAAAVVALATGALPSEAVAAAVITASAFVADGGAASLDLEAGPGQAPREPRPATDAEAVAARVRAEGGTVVATGGCFDLLHAGHVRTLQGARALGDCLIVCLNSDASVARLKGPERPIVGQADRAAVLASLGCVDAVVVFDDDTPVPILTRLRPDVFVKGGDYTAEQLPEAALLAGWGGQAVVLPYVEGRSTTRLLEEVTRRDRH